MDTSSYWTLFQLPRVFAHGSFDFTKTSLVPFAHSEVKTSSAFIFADFVLTFIALVLGAWRLDKEHKRAM